MITDDNSAFEAMLQGRRTYFPHFEHVSRLLLVWPFLRAMNESSLAAGERDSESYRLLWLRTRHHPICVLVEFNSSACAIVTTVLDGKGGYYPGSVKRSSHRFLSSAEAGDVRKRVEESEFWARSTTSERAGLDGSSWILEGARLGQHHIVVRWSPKAIGEDALVRSLCEYLLELGQVGADGQPVY